MKQSISDLSKLTGFDRRRIGKALADLHHQSGPKGAVMYESTDALPLLYLGEEGASLDGNKERARLTHHQANLAALDEREKSGELVSREAVVSEVSESLANMRAKLLTLPTKLSAVVVGLDDLYEIQAAIESGVYEALTELHNQYVDNEQSGGGIEAPAEAEG